MMNLSGECPGCHRPTFINFATPCQNRLNGGGICGFTIDTTSMSGGKTRRAKELKHTGPPASGTLKEHSWVGSGQYDPMREVALTSGNICFDSANDYFCLAHPIASGLATVAYPMSGTVEVAGYVVLPVNSRWQNYHPHFRVDQSSLTPVASGNFTLTSSGMTVSGVDVRSFDVWQSGQRVASYNPFYSGFIAVD
jgi:hypothetical protein